MNLPIAFVKWFQAESRGSAVGGGFILFEMAYNGPRDSLVWGLLEATGDKEYTPNTFVKAAQIVLDSKEAK